jgi:molecular chaperone DnaK (HSP70)
VKNIFLLDVTPLTRGVELSNEELNPIVKKNTPIPIKVSKVYSTAADNQTALNVKIWEWERTLAKDNHFLGELLIKGVPPKPKGEVEIDVQFQIDADGILKAVVSEKLTNQEVSATIDTRTLTKETVEKLIA